MRSVIIKTGNIACELRRDVGKTMFKERIWFKAPGSDKYEELHNIKRDDGAWDMLPPAKVEDIIERCRNAGYEVFIEDPDECDNSEGQNH